MKLDRLIAGLTPAQRYAIRTAKSGRISLETSPACRAALRKLGLAGEGEPADLTAFGEEIRARLVQVSSEP